MEMSESEIKTKTPEKVKLDETKYEMEKTESEELVYTKKSQNWLYKILKYNPIDPINDYFLKTLEKLDLYDKGHQFQWWLAFGIWCKNALRLFWRYEWEGELAPEHGAAILVSNHESHLDPFFVGGASQRPIRWMSKKENFKTPIVRTLFRNMGAFELDRDNPDEGWNLAKRLLENKEYVGIFPEGTRTEDGTLGEFRTGAVRLAIEMGVPIVPCAVIGSRNSLPKGKLVMKSTKVKVRVGKPIYYADFYGKRDVPYTEIRKLTNELRDIVIKLREELEDKGKSVDLSIGYPKDMEDKSSSFNPKKIFKRLGKAFLMGLDDFWYALLKSVELVGARDAFSKPIYGLTGIILNAFTDLCDPIRVVDFEKHLPEQGGALIACGHNSEWDVLMLPYAIWLKKNRRRLYQMSKESLFKIPIVNAWVRTHYAFPLRRGEHDISSFNQAKELLEQGELVVVYPEGTTNSGGGEILEGHTGAVRLAIEAKVPIIPVGVTGTEDIYPKHAKSLNFGKGCYMKAGEPIDLSKYYDKPIPGYEELKRLTDDMMGRIKNLMYYNDPEA